MLQVLLPALVAAADWPQFRGPMGLGVAEEKKLPVEFGHVAKNGAGAFLEEQAGGGEFDPAGGAFQERSVEAGFHALDLPGESALAETGACGSAGETAMAGHEVEEPKLVEIERNGGEELMHSVH